MSRYCLTLDLKNDPELITAYVAHHQNVWPEVINSIRSAGITGMSIYHIETRLFMIMEVSSGFSFANKVAKDKANPKVVEWEALMDQYQQRLPFTQPDEKWVLMNKIFEL
jgi:L-rhamnose mutarotase